MNVLLVEDDYLIAKVTARYLRRLGGHDVRVTVDPAEMFDLCQACWPSVVLMDVNIPGAKWEGKWVSGADLSRVLKTQPQTANLPILLVTAYAIEEDKCHLMAASLADELWAKPVVDYSSLVRAIESYAPVAQLAG
ncbi:MAG: response regulator [Cyanobacteria bacterium J06642_2]